MSRPVKERTHDQSDRSARGGRVVIGVDTHIHTHSAAVVDAGTGGVLDEVTVEATAEGYSELVEFVNNHATSRAWAIEGTGGHGRV